MFMTNTECPGCTDCRPETDRPREPGTERTLFGGEALEWLRAHPNQPSVKLGSNYLARMAVFEGWGLLVRVATYGDRPEFLASVVCPCLGCERYALRPEQAARRWQHRSRKHPGRTEQDLRELAEALGGALPSELEAVLHG